MGPSPTTNLAIAVSRAGGLGSVSTPGLLTPEVELRKRLRDRIKQVASNSNGSFALNVPVGTLPNGQMFPASEICIDEAINVKADNKESAQRFVAITTSAGSPAPFTESIHSVGLLHIHKVGSVRHARKAEDSGVDVVIASGAEMGGHTHIHPVHTMVLAPQVIAAVDCPVIVSGGVYDGRGLAAALAMGAAGVAMGTRFIATKEHEWHPAYKQAIVDAQEWSDMTYQGFYAPTRALRNAALLQGLPKAMLELSTTDLDRWKEDHGYAAQIEGDIENGIVIAGQCAAAINDIPSVGELIDRIMAQAISLLGNAASEAQEFGHDQFLSYS